MNITERRPKSDFDFGVAITQLFRTPGGVPWAMKLILATGILMGLTYVAAGFLIGGPYLNMIADMGEIGSDPDAAMSSFYALIPGYLLMTIGVLIVMVMGETALHRAVQRDQDTSGIPLRFGVDELRVLGASLGVWILGIIGFFLFMLAVAIVGGLLAVVASTLSMVVVGIGYLGGLCFWLFVVIRLSPAAALSVRQESAHLLAGTKISKHRFWYMFLTFLVVGFVGYVVNTIATLIGMSALVGDGSLFLMTGGEMGEASGEDIAQNFREVFSNPLVVILTIIGVMIYSCLTSAWLLSMAGIGSYFVKWWAADDEVSPFD